MVDHFTEIIFWFLKSTVTGTGFEIDFFYVGSCLLVHLRCWFGPHFKVDFDNKKLSWDLVYQNLPKWKWYKIQDLIRTIKKDTNLLINIIDKERKRNESISQWWQEKNNDKNEKSHVTQEENNLELLMKLSENQLKL